MTKEPLCEVCGEAAVDASVGDYYSLKSALAGELDGNGVCLCRTCCLRLDKLPIDSQQAILDKAWQRIEQEQSPRRKLLTEARIRLADAKTHVFRLQDIASALVRLKTDEPREGGPPLEAPAELDQQLQEARGCLEAADRQLITLGAYR